MDAKDEKGKNIVPSPCAKILGITFSNKSIWRAYLEAGKDAMIFKLKKKLAPLKITCKYATLESKL